MANPIYFKSVRYSNGTVTGYRPSMVCPGAADEIETAERVVLQAGLAMSPEELNLGVKAYLTLAPQFVAADGMTRTVNGLIKWYGSMGGNLPDEASDWNDATCKAQVKVSLLKDSKQLLAGPFRNEYQVDVPKINNISYYGATGVYNVVQPTMPIMVYGRFVQFDAALGDWAKLIVGNTEHALTCQSSGTAETKFLWPAGLAIPAGTAVEFAMSTCAGGLGRVTVNRKTVIAVAAPETGPRIVWVKDTAAGAVEGKVKVGASVLVKALRVDDTASAVLVYTDTGGTEQMLPMTTPTYSAGEQTLTFTPDYWPSDIDQTKGATLQVTKGTESDSTTVTFRE